LVFTLELSPFEDQVFEGDCIVTDFWKKLLYIPKSLKHLRSTYFHLGAFEKKKPKRQIITLGLKAENKCKAVPVGRGQKDAQGFCINLSAWG